MDKNSGLQESSSFGYWVRRRRLALDLTQAELARRVGCATVTIKKIEYDERRPSRQMAGRLAEALAVPPDESAAFIDLSQGVAYVHEATLTAQPLSSSPNLPASEWIEALDQLQDPVKFVGRDQEIAFLEARLEKALGGEGQVVLISGEAGRGKTALMAHFGRLAQQQHERLVVAQGFCTAMAGVGDPYLPFRDILLSLVGDLALRGQSGVLTAEQARRLVSAAPTARVAIRQDGQQLIDFLVPAASLEIPGSPAVRSSPAENSERHQLFDQVTTVLKAIANRYPLLLVIDDLQWADPASRNLLFHLGRRLAGSQIIIAGAYRPSEVTLASGDLEGRSLEQMLREFRRLYGDIVIDLEAFDVEQARQLSDALLDREPNRLDESFRQKLFWQTRGHPLFLVELLRELQDRGELVRDEAGRWVEDRPIDWEGLPARVTAVIEQRLSRLDDRLRRLLEVASVEGERFTAEFVADAARVEVGELLYILSRDAGRRHGLVREIGRRQFGPVTLARFQFSHVMFQHYLYESLGEGERCHLHGQIATALEAAQKDGDADGGLLAQLAHHFSAAGNEDRATAYLIRAGDRARSLYAHEEALDYFRRAVEFLRSYGNRETLARTMMKIGETYQTAFDFDRAQQAFDEAFALWPQVRRDYGEIDRFGPQVETGGTGQSAARVLRLLWFDPPSLDPTMGGYNLTAPVATQLFSGLVNYGTESEIVPDVAYRWEIEEGGRRYVFHLRDDVSWSDGRPVTAHDFAFTYRRALDPATNAPVAGQLLEPIKGARAALAGQLGDLKELGIQAVDNRTLIIEVETPTSYFIHNLAYYVSLPVPQHVVEAHGVDWASPAHLVTNGPFLMGDWVPGRHMRLKRNPGYHGSFSGNLDEVHLVLDQPREAQVDLYLAGELDIASNWFGTVQDIDRLRQANPQEFRRQPSFVTMFYFVECSLPPFHDLRVRQALAMALDLQALEVSLGGDLDPALGGLVPPGMAGHVPSCHLPFNPDLARQLLAEAGFPGATGFPDLKMLSSPFGRSLAPFLIDSWERILGIRVQQIEVFRLTDWERMKADPATRIFLGGWWADYPDPDNFMRVLVKLDVSDWFHEEFNLLIERASLSSDQAKRLAHYRRAEEILADEAPLVPLAYVPNLQMLKPWVKRYPTAAVKYPGFWKDVVINP